ncbi:MAG: nitroreductase family protein [Lachnospiraceae bacterium]|nr:nitroreductase family protein [Lachnospiraceae bacterium]
MELIDIMLKRRSMRKYTEDEIPEEKLEKILQAGLLAPTSQNRRPCEFYVINDKATLKKLSKAKKFGAGMLADCSVAVAVFGDSDKADTWIEDCSIALSYMNLMAAEQGIGSCWCQIHLRSSLLGKDAENSVRETLIVPERYRIVGILALGIPAQEAKAHTMEDIDWSKVHRVKNV